MKTICLIPKGGEGEQELSRMLELELTDRGIPTCREKEGDEPTLFLFLFATVGQEEAEVLTDFVRQGSHVPLLCCAREFVVPLPSEIIPIERPFSVKRLCESLRLAVTEPESVGSAIVTPTKRYAPLTVDRASRTVTCHGERIALTEREYALLEYLDRKRGTPVSREELLREIWGSLVCDTNRVDVYVRHLREKIDDRFDTRYLITVRHRGYCLRRLPDEDDESVE